MNSDNVRAVPPEWGRPEAMLPSLPPSTWLMSGAQAINLTCAVLSVTVAATLGAQLAPSPGLATAPYGLQFAVVMVLTYPAAMLMRRFGRRPVFAGAAFLLMASGFAGYASAQRGEFLWLLAAHGLLGAYIACANFYRFAVADHVAPALKARAMAWVVAGGVLAAFAGPALAAALHDVAGFEPFSLVYGVLVALGALNLVLIGLWRPAAAKATPACASLQADGKTVVTASARLAIAGSAASYLVMNLLMVQATLVMRELCSFAQGSAATQWHVLAMFAPSFITGRLMGRIGIERVLVLGLGLLAASAACAWLELTYVHLVIGLVLLGLGWNLSYVAGGALLARSVDGPRRHAWQGLHDTAVAACATVGAFAPAALLQGVGWRATNIGLAVVCAVGALCAASALKRPADVARA